MHGSSNGTESELATATAAGSRSADTAAECFAVARRSRTRGRLPQLCQYQTSPHAHCAKPQNTVPSDRLLARAALAGVKRLLAKLALGHDYASTGFRLYGGRASLRSLLRALRVESLLRCATTTASPNYVPWQQRQPLFPPTWPRPRCQILSRPRPTACRREHFFLLLPLPLSPERPLSPAAQTLLFPFQLQSEQPTATHVRRASRTSGECIYDRCGRPPPYQFTSGLMLPD